MRTLLLAAAILSATATVASADRLKDVATVEGVRANELTGYGVVVGLAGTGDDASSPVARQSLANLLARLGTKIDASQIKSKNVATVIITAKLPPFARPGQALDVTVSSMGSSKSLAGGTLVASPLKGPDGKTWALAQGAIAVGGFLAEGDGASTRKNHVTVARIPNGALVERDAPTQMPVHHVTLMLRQPDFTTAARIADAIDRTLGVGTARARDAGAVEVEIAPGWRDQVPQLIARLEAIEVEPDGLARVVVDERTGTVVIGGTVRLRAGAIAYGGLTITIAEQPIVSQPAPASRGKTAIVPDTKLDVAEGAGQLHALPAATTVTDVIAALNALGVKPRDLIAILQNLASSGALRAQVEVL